MKARIVFKGGAGSGHHGHEGRPGKVGGSVAGAGSGNGENFDDYTDTDYDKEITRVAYRAISKGIKTFDTSSKAQMFAREAADVINSQKKIGYTVYGSTMSSISETDEIEYFPMVEYGAGTSSKGVRRMMNILQDNGFMVSTGPQNSGIVVGHRSWK